MLRAALDREPGTEIDQVPSPVSDVPGSLHWRSVVGTAGSPRLVIRPRVPDKSFVIRFAEPLDLAAGASWTIQGRVPLWVEVLADQTTVIDEPSVPFTQTWFGGPQTGRVCYRADTEFPIRPPWPPVGMLSAGVSVTVRNQTKKSYSFGRMAVPVEQSAVLRSEADGFLQLWDAVALYSGEDRLELSMTAPKPPLKAVELSPPRRSPAEVMLERSFILLRRITNY